MSRLNAGGAKRWIWCALGGLSIGLLALVLFYGIARSGSADQRRARAAIATGKDLIKKGQPEQALRAVADLRDEGPWTAGVLAIRGLALAALDRSGEARPLLEQSLKRDANQPMVAKVLAAVYFADDESDRGLAMLDRAARLDPGDFRPWFAAGDYMLRFRGQPAEAAKLFRAALRRKAGHDESRIGLLRALLDTGADRDAAPLMKAVLRDHSGDPNVLCLAARLARLEGRLDDMGRYAQQATSLDPQSVEALVLYAQFLRQTGKRQEALPYAERASALDPNSLAALTILATLEGSLGLQERATATSARARKVRDRLDRREKLKEEIIKRPNDPEPRWRMGQLALEGGDTFLAVKSFRSALALDPNCIPARQGLMALARGDPSALPQPGSGLGR